MKTYSKVLLQKRSGYTEVFIYYSRHGYKFRESTQVKIPDTELNPEGVLAHHKEKIKKLHSYVEGLIIAYIGKNKEKPPVKWLIMEYSKLKDQLTRAEESVHSPTSEIPLRGVDLEEIESLEVELVSSDEVILRGDSFQNDLLFFWDEFLQFKRMTVRSEGTIKRYGNLATTLRKFQLRHFDYGYDYIGVSVLGQEFFIDFLYYMIKEHEYVHSNRRAAPSIVVLPETGVSNSTAIKRMTDLIEYLKFCKRKKGVQLDIDDLKDCVRVARHKLEVAPDADETKWEVTLTTEELEFVVNLHKYEPDYYDTLSHTQKRYLEIFIFMCLQGTAPADTRKIKRTDLVNGNLVGRRAKSNTGFKVELDDISAGILKQFDYNLNFSEQSLNEAVKKIFVTVFELYRPRFEKKYREAYQLIYTQKKFKGKEETHIIQHKGLFVEGMTGRRTFITNLNEESGETDLRSNMRRTGHLRPQTHLGYQKERQTGKPRKTTLFGIKRERQDTGKQTPNVEEKTDNEVKRKAGRYRREMLESLLG